jgi:hypothetical protein
MTRHIRTAFGLAVALAAAPAAAQQPQIVEQVIVRVNGDIVTKSDFERRTIDTLRAQPELVNMPAGSPAFIQAVAEVTPQLILDAVDELLLVQRGREMGYALGDVQFQQPSPAPMLMRPAEVMILDDWRAELPSRMGREAKPIHMVQPATLRLIQKRSKRRLFRLGCT